MPLFPLRKDNAADAGSCGDVVVCSRSWIRARWHLWNHCKAVSTGGSGGGDWFILCGCRCCGGMEVGVVIVFSAIQILICRREFSQAQKLFPSEQLQQLTGHKIISYYFKQVRKTWNEGSWELEMKMLERYVRWNLKWKSWKLRGGPKSGEKWLKRGTVSSVQSSPPFFSENEFYLYLWLACFDFVTLYVLLVMRTTSATNKSSPAVPPTDSSVQKLPTKRGWRSSKLQQNLTLVLNT